MDGRLTPTQFHPEGAEPIPIKRVTTSHPMRASFLLLAATLLVGGEGDDGPWLPPPADPAAGPLPSGLRFAFSKPRQRVLFGDPLTIEVAVSSGATAIEILGETHHLAMDITLTRPDGSQVHEPASPIYVLPGMTRLGSGAHLTFPVSLYWRLRPNDPGIHRLSVFADLGWGPERPDDPRRTTCELDCVLPDPEQVPDLVARAMAGERHAANRAEFDQPQFVPVLRPLAAAGSIRALEHLATTPGRDAVDALLAIAQDPPGAWHDLQDGERPNLGFLLLDRLADHLPPRRLPQEEVWWEQPGSAWRRRMMAGVPRELLPRARAAALAWLEREPAGAAEVLVWAGEAADRPALLQAMRRHAAERAAPNQLHALWRLAYAILLADPAAPPPDPTLGLAEQVLWACHRANASGAGTGLDQERIRSQLAAADPLVRRIAVWAVPRPVPAELIPVLVALLADPASDEELTRSLYHKLRDCDDPGVLNALAAGLADPERCRYLSDDLIDRFAERRVAASRALVARARAKGSGDECLRRIARLCLSVRPVLSMQTIPDVEGWQPQVDAWERWLDRHADRLQRGPIPAGDPAQPNHWLAPRWWFEAADGRRWFRPPPAL
jgi:hypothetical protein